MEDVGHLVLLTPPDFAQLPIASDKCPLNSQVTGRLHYITLSPIFLVSSCPVPFSPSSPHSLYSQFGWTRWTRHFKYVLVLFTHGQMDNYIDLPPLTPCNESFFVPPSEISFYKASFTSLMHSMQYLYSHPFSVPRPVAGGYAIPSPT